MIRIHRPTDWHWLSLIGPDAQDFLHRVTTVNVRELAPGHGAPGFILNAQGRIRAAFRLWCYRESEYALEFASGLGGRWKTELLAAIDQYTFAEKMTLADVSGLECRWIFADETPSLLKEVQTGQTVALEDEIRVCHQGSRDFARPWISVWGRGARLEQWIDRCFGDALNVSPEELDLWRVEAVHPWVDREILPDATIPLEVGMPEGVSSNKGCYPGQEVIERIVSLGAPARRLARIEGDGTAPAPGDKLLNQADAPTEVGEVTTVWRDGSRFKALAMIRKIHAREGLPVRTTPGGSAVLTQISSYQ